MYTYSIFHISGTLDACPIEGRMHLRLRAERGAVAQAKLIYVCDKNQWLSGRQEAWMRRAFADSELEYFSVSVPLTDTRFAYIFELASADGSAWFLSEEGLTRTYDHALAFYNFFQYTSQFPCDVMTVPDWVRTATAYQIFPERFAPGSGEHPGRLTGAWGEKPTPKSFFGGSLNGIREKLDYLEDLGVNLLYLNPVFCAPSNHKYDTTDYTRVDPAFGGNEALKALLDDAHRRGMRVILDGVFNHMSSGHPFFVDAKERGKASPWYDWFFWNPDGSYRTFGSVRYMPKLNTGNWEVIRYFSDLAVGWMADYGVDGWRLDVSDEMSHRFLRHFREAVLARRPDAVLIGEDWHRAPRYLQGDEYDGTMNYGFTKACLDLFAYGTIDAAAFRDRLVRLYHTTSLAASAKMWNLLDSHDTHRFLTQAGGDRRKLRAALAMLFFYPGIPCIYYGDEIGMEGGYDPDSRRCFDWNEDHWDTETRSLVRKLAGLKRRPALSRGDFGVAEAGGILTFTRSSPEERLALCVNPADSPRGGLPPYGFEIRSEQEK